MKISVIMPTVGRPQIRRSLDSVLPYLGEDDELIVIGDGEQPLSRAACEERERRQLLYVEHENPESTYGWAQRNFGMSIATGDVLAFLDDDDTYLPNAIASIRREAEKGRPMIFRREITLGDEPTSISWTEPRMIKGEVGTGMFAVPRVEGLYCPCPMDMTKISHGFTDFIWINHILDTLWAPNAVSFCFDIIYCCKGYGGGGKESNG